MFNLILDRLQYWEYLFLDWRLQKSWAREQLVANTPEGLRLFDEVIYLLDEYSLYNEDGSFTFPNGDIYYKYDYSGIV